ncbi:hypothetical protein SI65_08528 [Aspergillus cristatus]|uniref:Succinate dehydrogenase assembly factor 4, mitochondrial n=1 Tax=Aspergillus cristatus TaxID=573508 RepID=A0A1E3B5A1_ASPCR|nr:hypothetical protein SI65_08528 [Aspergillus cristatus]
MALFLTSRRAFTPSIASRSFLTRPLSTSPVLSADSPFKSGPAPPRLPKEEQEIFEELQRKPTGAFSTPQVNQSPASEAEAQSHPDKPAGMKPEFEGEKNPNTGEVGGPKNEPLRWGSDGDWSYGGRVTDF